jgi:hypothetical protein
MINGDFWVGDYEFDSASVELNLSDYNDDHFDDPPQLIGAAVGNRARIQGNRVIDEVSGNVNIRIRFAVGRNWNLGMLLDIMKEQKPKLISVLSHELFHQFEHHKLPNRDARLKASYESYQGVRIQNVQPLNKFLHLLYFIHETERYTRPSEFYGELKANNVTKEKFKEFFKESQIIKDLEECRDYTFAGLMNDLRNHMDEIDEFLNILKTQGAEIDMDVPDSVKINNLLKYFHIILNNATMQEYMSILKSGINPFAAMFTSMAGIENPEAEQAQKHLDDFVKEIQKFKNYQDFFDYWIKKINFVGETTIKKLSKLYAMVDNDKDSIVNWDLHHKINRTADKTKMRLQELIKDPDTKITKKK